MKVRLAEREDIDQLIRMRWDFSIEHNSEIKTVPEEYAVFEAECQAFFNRAFDGDKWVFWVAETDGVVVSHIFLERIEKVPRPGRVTRPFLYMTNVYTKPEFRGKGVGSQLLSAVNEWAEQDKNEFIIVWPSDEGVPFYERNGYTRCVEPLEKVF